MMSMSMGSGFRVRQIIAIPCPQCGSKDGHYEGCLQVILEGLLKQQKHIQCPKCGANGVDVNLDDFYECRKCQTQYTTGAYDDSWERVHLIVDLYAPISEGVRTVLVHPNKGTGEFSIDKKIAEVQKAIEAKLTKKSRKRKKHSE